MSRQKLNFQKSAYLFSFLLPALIFFLYFASKHFNLLTVDLGQQYIDLLAYLRANLFSHPLKLIYSWSNGLGGSMIATDAYYLLSPFNLLLFLFPQSALPEAILVIICCKLGTAGVTTFYYFKHFKQNSPILSLAAAFAYALSGFTVANYFNLMWLDSVILLPLLVLCIDQVIDNQKNHLVFITFALIVTNFYTGSMALFFGFLYFLAQLWLQQKKFLKYFKNYLVKSITGALLAAFIIFPVLGELIINRRNQSYSWHFWQFMPFNLISKLADGSYNYHEMEAGMPNIFSTLPFTLGSIAYFLTSKKREIFINGLLFIFLLLSLVFTPFVLLWHLGQFPVWYPGRFSFVLIFYCILLTMAFFKKAPVFKLWQEFVLGMIAIMIVLYWYLGQKEVTFLKQTNLLISTMFIVLSLLFYFFIYRQHRLAKGFLLIVVTLEVITNLILSLNNLSFQHNQNYQQFAQSINKTNSYLAKHDSGLFRTEKSFSRSDDDPFTGNYNGLTTFNSITNQKVLRFMAKLGYLHNSNSYTNQGGSLLTDSLLGVKYYVQPTYGSHSKLIISNNNQRLDLNNYELIQKNSQLTLYKNKNALPLLFSATAKNSKYINNDPIKNQEHFWQAITGSKKQLFKKIPLRNAKRSGVFSPRNSPNLYLIKHTQKYHAVSFSVTLNNNDSYYLLLPIGLTNKQIDLVINQDHPNLTVRDDQSHLINIANQQRGQHLKISFILTSNQVDLTNVQLYCFNNQLFMKEIHQFKQKQPKIQKISSLKLQTKSFSTKKKQTFKSTIPASPNWMVFDHGYRIKTTIFASAFLSFKLAKGQHHLTLLYIPWPLLLGSLVSILTLIFSYFATRRIEKVHVK